MGNKIGSFQLGEWGWWLEIVDSCAVLIHFRAFWKQNLNYLQKSYSKRVVISVGDNSLKKVDTRVLLIYLLPGEVATPITLYGETQWI